jgi:hypothetical protein
MPDKWYTAASGNWSTAANWNGGTLPLAGDDVFADGKTITIDQNVNVGTIRNTLRSGGTTGGTFLVTSGGFTITTTSAQGFFPNAATYLLQLSHTTGTNTINGSLICPGTNTNGVSISGAGGTTNINGNLTTNGASTALLVSAISTVNIVGTLQSGTSSVCGSITGAATINITGNVTAGAGAGAGLSNTLAAATINITGNVSAGAAAAGISSTVASTITVVGTITSTNTQPAILMTNASSTLTISTPVVNVGGRMAVDCEGFLRIYAAATAQWTFQNESGTSKILYSAGIPLGNPTTSDVRNGTAYGASLELTGTLVVPSPNNVVAGVPTDNTVGTYATTPALIAAQVRTELAVELARIDAAISSRLSSAGYTAPNNSDITAIKAKTDQLAFTSGNVDAIAKVVSDKTGYELTSTERTNIAAVVEAALINDGDGQALINAIVASIGNQNIDEVLLIAAIRADIERAGGLLDATKTNTDEIITTLDNLDVSVDTQAISDNVWADEPERLKNVATVESTGDQIATLL